MLQQDIALANTTKTEKPISSSRPRTKFNEEQLFELERLYQFNSKPLKEMMQELGDKVGLEIRTVQVWFQNRRVKDRSTSNSLKDEGSLNFSGLTSVDNNRYMAANQPPPYSPYHNQNSSYPFTGNDQNKVDDKPMFFAAHAQGRTPLPPGAAMLINQVNVSYSDKPRRAIAQRINSFTEKLMAPAPWQIERSISMDNKNANSSFATFVPRDTPTRSMPHANPVPSESVESTSYTTDNKLEFISELMNNNMFEYNQKFIQPTFNNANKRDPNQLNYNSSQNPNPYPGDGCCSCPSKVSLPDVFPTSYPTNKANPNINLSSFDPLLADQYNSTQSICANQPSHNTNFQNLFNTSFNNHRLTEHNIFNNQSMNSVGSFNAHEIGHTSIPSQVGIQNFEVDCNPTANLFNHIPADGNFQATNRMGIDIPQSHHLHANAMNTLLNNSYKNQSPGAASYSSSYGTGAFVHINEISGSNSNAAMWRNQQHQGFSNGSWY